MCLHLQHIFGIAHTSEWLKMLFMPSPPYYICWTKVVSLTVFCVLLTMLGTYSNRPDFWFRSLFWTTSMTNRKQNLNVENRWVWTPITVHTPWIVTSVLESVSVSSINFFFCCLLNTFYCSLFCCPQNLFIANHRYLGKEQAYSLYVPQHLFKLFRPCPTDLQQMP